MNTLPTREVGEDPPLPMERLEARICELAGHLTAATCQFLLLVADFDAREGWAAWEMPSCAAWLSWKCQIAPGTAREQVRVARSLAAFPMIREEFAAGRLSYAKVRALTRIATADTERDLVEMATPMTAAQLERFARAHRRVTRSEEERARARRKLSWTWVDDFEFTLRAQLPAEEAAVVLQALRAFTNDLEHPHSEDHDHDGGAVGSRAAAADNPDTYQVIIHAGTSAITVGEDPDVSAETGKTVPPLAFPVSHPASLDRCHVEDGSAISPATLQMIACNATISTMLHDADGKILDVGRRTRKPSVALRRAVRERDRYRCRFPGCESRRVDLHHILFWANGGETKLGNLLCLCKRHHTVVHDKGIVIATTGDGFAFYLPGGTPIPASPSLPASSPGGITGCHGAVITPETIIPPNSGERLDLHMALWIALSNAEVQAKRRQQEPPRVECKAA